MVWFHDFENNIHLEGDIDMIPVFIFSGDVQYQYEYDFLIDKLENLIGFNIYYKESKYHYSKRDYEVKFELDENGDFKTIVMEPK